ncbi:MAG: hypothetical protein GY768_33110 [Planctomycetaceae bacterium]|nr:hypothetical protein [Planctomycetaceae bacterium]
MGAVKGHSAVQSYFCAVKAIRAAWRVTARYFVGVDAAVQEKEHGSRRREAWQRPFSGNPLKVMNDGLEILDLWMGSIIIATNQMFSTFNASVGLVLVTVDAVANQVNMET